MKPNTKLENLDSFLSNQVFISVDQTTAMTYNVFIDEDIQDASYYRNLHNVLENASEIDTVVFHLSTQGGQVDSAVTICNLIQATEAHTVALLKGEVCSAGTLFAMSCDSVIAMPHSSMMIHAASYGTGGPMSKVKGYVEFCDKHLRNILESFYKGFLSDAELEDIITNQKDIWITGEEVIQRLENRDAKEREEEETPPPIKKRSKKPIIKE